MYIAKFILMGRLMQWDPDVNCLMHANVILPVIILMIHQIFVFTFQENRHQVKYRLFYTSASFYGELVDFMKEGPNLTSVKKWKVGIELKSKALGNLRHGKPGCPNINVGFKYLHTCRGN